MITIKYILDRFKTCASLHPNINYFGVGSLSAMTDNIQNYPYMWIVPTLSHTLVYSEDNGYKGIEFQFTLRVGDKVNDQDGYDDIRGLGTDNSIDIASDTFTTLLDIINSISADSLLLFSDIKLIDNILIEPFFNEDASDVTGNEATITLRIKNYKVCTSPLTDNANELS